MSLSSNNDIALDRDRVLLIADLHLQPGDTTNVARFIAFLNSLSASGDALIILGDLFDAWIGPELLDDFAPLLQAIKATVERGLWIGFLPGNRDFLLSEPFFKHTGVNALAPITVLTYNKRRIVLLHGDQFCLKDPGYRTLYETTRNPHWQDEILKEPRARREAWVAHLRQNFDARPESPEDYLRHRVTPADIQELCESHQADSVIYGHFHTAYQSRVSTPQGALLTQQCLPEWKSDLDYLALTRQAQ